MGEIDCPRFELTRQYENGYVEEPKIFSLEYVNQHFSTNRRAFLKIVSSGIGIPMLNTLFGCGGGGGGSESPGSNEGNPPDPNSNPNPELENPPITNYGSEVVLSNYYPWFPISLSINFSEGTLASTGELDGSIKLWDLPSTGLLKKILGPPFIHPNQISLSDNGLISAKIGNNRINIWDVHSGTVVSSLIASYEDNGISSISPDGTLIAISNGGNLSFRKADTGVEIYNLPAAHPVPIRSLTFSKSGNWLVTSAFDAIAGADPGSIRIWNIAGGYRGYPACILPSHRVSSVSISGDESMLAAAVSDGGVEVWDFFCNLLYRFDMPGDGTDRGAVAFSPDNRFIAAIGDSNIIIIWDLTDPSIPIQLNSNGSPTDYAGIAFRNDSKVLAVCVDRCDIEIWDLSTRDKISDLKIGKEINDVLFSPSDGYLAVLTYSNTIRLYDDSSFSFLRNITIAGHTERITRILYSSDGSIFATTSDDGSVKLWDSEYEDPYCTLDVSAIHHHHPIAFSSTGDMIATTDINNAVKIFETNNGSLIGEYEKYTERVTSLSFSPDQKMIASASKNGVVRVHFVNDSSLVRMITLDTDVFSVCRFSPDGKLLATYQPLQPASSLIKTKLTVWSVPDFSIVMEYEQIPEYKPGYYMGEYGSIDISPDGKYIAISSEDHIIKVIEIYTNSIFRTLKGHTNFISCLSFLEDSQHIVSGGADGTIKLWNIDEESPINCFFDPNTLESGNQVQYYSITRDDGQVIMYTLPCESKLPDGSPCTCNCAKLPDDSSCTCNCVSGTQKPRDDPPSGGGPNLCSCNLVCICVPVSF